MLSMFFSLCYVLFKHGVIIHCMCNIIESLGNQIPERSSSTPLPEVPDVPKPPPGKSRAKPILSSSSEDSESDKETQTTLRYEICMLWMVLMKSVRKF